MAFKFLFYYRLHVQCFTAITTFPNIEIICSGTEGFVQKTDISQNVKMTRILGGDLSRNRASPVRKLIHQGSVPATSARSSGGHWLRGQGYMWMSLFGDFLSPGSVAKQATFCSVCVKQNQQPCGLITIKLTEFKVWKYKNIQGLAQKKNLHLFFLCVRQTPHIRPKKYSTRATKFEYFDLFLSKSKQFKKVMSKNKNKQARFLLPKL